MRVTTTIKVGVWDLQPASDGYVDIGGGSSNNGFTGA